MAGLTFEVLGPLRVSRDGRIVTVPEGRRRSALVCLLLTVPEPVSAEALIEAAWPPGQPHEPRAALHTVISRLRSLLGGDAIVAETGGYRLDVPADAVDARRFERVCRESVVAPPEQAAALLDLALGLWRGPAYADLAGRDATVAEIGRLDLLHADALEERARLALELGDPADAVRRLESLLRERPFREHAVELLMRSLQRCDRTAQALARYREHRALMVGELGLEPSTAVQQLNARLLAGDGSTVSQETEPVPEPLFPQWVDTSTLFVGREDDAARLAVAVAAGRLVTVTGPGGVGKTRLVAESLPRLAALTRLPVVVAELATVEHPGLDVALASAIGLTDLAAADGSLPAALVARLRAHPALLVLDNAEHLLDDLTPVVDILVSRVPPLRVVVTSRRRTGLAHESVLELAPLPMPTADDAPAVQLVLDRVQHARPALTITPVVVGAIADICRRVDGLPLVLELAASRVAALGAVAVRDRLERDLTMLDPDRVTAMVDWSTRLLPRPEYELFALLSVFASRFELDAVESLAAAMPEPPPMPVAPMLADLVDASLVTVTDTSDPPRYRMLTVVRAEAARILNVSGRAEAARLAHVRWVVELTERAARDVTSPRSVGALATLDRHREDLEVALRHALDEPDLDLASRISEALGVCPHWSARPRLLDLVIETGEAIARDGGAHPGGVAAAAMALALRGRLARCRELAEPLLVGSKAPLNARSRYLAQTSLGVAALYAGDLAEAERHWRSILKGTDLAPALQAEAHSSLALLLRFQGDTERASEEGTAAMLLAESSGAASVQAFARYAAGEAALRSPDRGASLLAAAGEEAATIGARHVELVAGVALLAALVRDGRPDDAAVVATRTVRIARETGAWPQLWTCLRIVAELLAATGHPEQSAFLLCASERAADAPPPMGEDIPRYAALRRLLADELGGTQLERIREAASSAGCDPAAKRALAWVDRVKPSQGAQ